MATTSHVTASRPPATEGATRGRRQSIAYRSGGVHTPLDNTPANTVEFERVLRKCLGPHVQFDTVNTLDETRFVLYPPIDDSDDTVRRVAAIPGGLWSTRRGRMPVPARDAIMSGMVEDVQTLVVVRTAVPPIPPVMRTVAVWVAAFAALVTIVWLIGKLLSH